MSVLAVLTAMITNTNQYSVTSEPPENENSNDAFDNQINPIPSTSMASLHNVKSSPLPYQSPTLGKVATPCFGSTLASAEILILKFHSFPL